VKEESAALESAWAVATASFNAAKIPGGLRSSIKSQTTLLSK
jgi:hypothetical protein